jgi:hypothetical protein
MSKKPAEGDLPSPHSTELEDILDKKEFLIKFRDFLSSIYSLENFDFWLEAGMSTILRKRKDPFGIYCGVFTLHKSTMEASRRYIRCTPTDTYDEYVFGADTETFRHLQDDAALAPRAQEIFDKYFSPNSDTPVNIDDASQEEVRGTDSHHRPHGPHHYSAIFFEFVHYLVICNEMTY